MIAMPSFKPVERWRSTLTIVAVALAGCSGSSSAENAQAPAAVETAKGAPMSEQKCDNDPVSRSVCMIRMILDDVAKDPDRGGGGISQIKAASSTSYEVALPKEGRIVHKTYSFEVKEGSIRMNPPTERVESF